MSHFLAISFRPGRVDPHQQHSLAATAERLFQRFASCPAQTVHFESDFLILSSTPSADHYSSDFRGNFCLLVPCGCYHVDKGQIFTVQSQLEQFLEQGISFAKDLAPPWAACLGIQGEKKVVCATDSQGLQHLYTSSGDSWAAVSSSCLMLGAWSGAEIDLDSMSAYARVGNYLHDRTPFKGVSKIPAGGYAQLFGGTLEQNQYQKRSCPVPYTDRQAAFDAGLDILAHSITTCLKAYPDAGIELSGGLDSRLILSAIPPQQRKSLRSLTLGYPGSPDCVTAGRIAREWELHHQVIDLTTLDDTSETELVTRIKTSSEKVGHCSNPFSRRVLDWVNETAAEGPRFSGQNGEFARGFYYAGQPDADRPSLSLVEGLMKWRIFTNQAVNLEIFRKESKRDIEEAGRRAVQESLLASDLSWLSATDEFYLAERMQRWVGVDYSSSSRERIILAPFFHPGFVQWARGVPPRFKRGGNLMAGLLIRLDPALGKFPLDSGLLPQDLAHPRLHTHLRQKFGFFKKAAHKAWQRIARHGKPPVGADLLCRRLLQTRKSLSNLLPRVWESGMLDPAAMRRLDQGTGSIDWVSLGFLLQYEWLLEISETRTTTVQ